jgi:hypothetical protein
MTNYTRLDNLAILYKPYLGQIIYTLDLLTLPRTNYLHPGLTKITQNKLLPTKNIPNFAAEYYY